uniref:Uncharacterized protein n=1 Tax=Arundo donax TaxID=35708 RepID=A0A0A9GWM8_ARUDO
MVKVHFREYVLLYCIASHLVLGLYRSHTLLPFIDYWIHKSNLIGYYASSFPARNGTLNFYIQHC